MKEKVSDKLVHLEDKLRDIEFKLLELQQDQRYAPKPRPLVILETLCAGCNTITPHISNIVERGYHVICTTGQITQPLFPIHTCLVCGLETYKENKV